ncbi:MAG: ATP-grasp domain-containing protein, partial [Clostridia bacterium]|nr:ATP-grasp domain-containing protein [Clostridia bacterium]
GEIAVRAIRACREMDIGTVAVYTVADRDSLHVKYADEAVCIGENKAVDSYLDFYRILSTASVTHADAIYPGTGFLSENATFSKACAEAGVHFIGAGPETLHMLGDKILAKQAAVNSGLPIVPASEGCLMDVSACLREAERIGYPVLLKAVDGGGGKGIRKVSAPEEMEEAFNACVNEARAAFGSDKIFLEKCLENVRHVEVQILADSFGNAIHLFDRDCTMQRRHQKMIEEAVSPFVQQTVKEKIYADAVRIIKNIHYVGAATVEFLADRDGHYYFMEVNPRIQVEHPVTELVTGLDIVKEQISVALGEPLSIRTPEAPRGHAIEARINAEDPSRNFMSSIGRVTGCTFPAGNGIRVETFIHDGIRISPYYDSMIAKIIAYADTRELAVKRLQFALDELDIGGITTNAPLQKELLGTDAFMDGSSHTTFVEEYLEAGHE